MQFEDLYLDFKIRTTKILKICGITAIMYTVRTAINWNVFLMEFSLSLLDLPHVKLGTNDIWLIYRDAHPKLNTAGKKI